MERRVFSTKEFREFARDVVLFYHLTTHVESDKDQDLLRFMSNRVAFPTVLYLTLKGEVMHKHAGERTVSCFEKEIHGYHQLHYARLRLSLGEKPAVIDAHRSSGCATTAL